MNEVQMSDLTGFDWAVLWDSLRPLGIDFAIRLRFAAPFRNSSTPMTVYSRIPNAL